MVTLTADGCGLGVKAITATVDCRRLRWSSLPIETVSAGYICRLMVPCPVCSQFHFNFSPPLRFVNAVRTSRARSQLENPSPGEPVFAAAYNDELIIGM